MAAQSEHESALLERELEKQRLGSYARLKGGFPVLLAGASYWLVLGLLGWKESGPLWYWVALFGSGAIFPLALLYAALFKNNFLKDRTAVSSVLLPTFISMLLFWPMAIAALWEGLTIFPLILAIGLSLHFPVIGWSYGRTVPFSLHAIIRAVVVFLIWWLLPEFRLNLLPLAVALLYLLMVAFVLFDSAKVQTRLTAS
ncbi:hypothetical protein JCM17845_01290 [Iodidimonas gelatinilytica]|uniref:Uncharacterized protein n=1 Tax=Iodidimonas gelatinilytica TaxID=1236966 RepID=A0A5A7MXB8_9PROT|nr:hypothetical protein [Iodidimonas gelatinilytica]GEQ99505.1 hypothetical protein JCM17845_01290 [Iodidimonas gelatinilytica]